MTELQEDILYICEPSLLFKLKRSLTNNICFVFRARPQKLERYQKLVKYLIVKYMDGNVKKEKNGKFERNEYGMPVQPSWPGYTQDYYNTVVKGSGDRLKVVEPEK